jgi:preprotein translocase subunit SecA
MATETKPQPYDQYVRRLAEVKAADAHALSDEALRAKTENLRRRLMEAKTRKSG